MHRRAQWSNKLTTPPATPLLENAIDSLEHGIAHYVNRDEAPTAIKHAVLNIYHSIELFLKERLARVNPLFIYRNIDKRVSGESQTVGLTEIVIRMENIGIPLTAQHVHVLTELQRRRNRIEHHRFDPTEDHELLVGRALKLLLEFLPAHLGAQLEDLVESSRDYRKVLEAILSYKERVERALAEATAQGGRIVCCPDCGEETVAIDSDRGPFCFLCHEEQDLEECEQCGEYVEAAEVFEIGICSDGRDNILSQVVREQSHTHNDERTPIPSAPLSSE